ncbi:glycoside hydrolase family 6 protein [Streptomyces abyssomicinicus]|uniref:glycoside hydrolase family 6 protein n=1 Tax=Streptomyces abyssomicinicus TaxID=574929 RepID=UPI001FEC9720|nr:glycoside hydrolase family 6 protein [Streptomyces abyssomicinicus]
MRSRFRRVRSAVTALVLGAALTVAAGGPVGAGTGADRVDNPYAGAAGVYVNPEWSARAAAEPGGEQVAGRPTFVWLDSIASVRGTGGRLGLRGHLDQALRQASGRSGFVFQVVLHDLPGRACAHPARQGELGPGELDAYKARYVDPIAAILGHPKYAALRIVTVVEPGSVLDLAMNAVNTPGYSPLCRTILDNGDYVNGIGYALARLGAVANTYNYLDAGHHAALGYPYTAEPYVDLLRQAASASGSTPGNVHGVIANTAEYFALHEPYFSVGDIVNGAPVHQSRWVDWNSYVDELPFVHDLRTRLVDAGFPVGVGALIDTSRNGWGGPARPSGPGPTTSVDAYVDGSRIDRRLHVTNWCNQSGAGLGERPATAPAPGVDAYVWAKPPGESDGAARPASGGGDVPLDVMCDPDYSGSGGGSRPTGAMRDAPPYGGWFPAAFRQLVGNAHPPLTG